MKKVFLIHAIVELVAGIILLFKPDMLLMTTGQMLETIVVAKLYGILALTFGVICIMLYNVFEYNDTFKKIALMLMFFHMMISFQMYAAYTQEIVPNLGAFGLHMLLAVLFFGAYMNDLNAFSKENNSLKI